MISIYRTASKMHQSAGLWGMYSHVYYAFVEHDSRHIGAVVFV